MATAAKELPINSWCETRNFHPKDRRLRLRGWKIFSRANNAPAIWISEDGRELDEIAATLEIEELEAKELEEAKAAMDVE